MALRLQHRRATQDLEPGSLPEGVGLSAARKKADEACSLVGDGLDPSNARKEARTATARQRVVEQRASAGLPPLDSFEAVAREWYVKSEPTWAPSHAEKIIRRLERDVFPWIGARPVAAIRPAEAKDELRESLAGFENRVTAITDKAKTQTVKYMAAKADEATRRSVDQQGRAMADAARIALGAEVGAMMQRWQATLQPSLDQRRKLRWEAWLTHIAAAVIGSAATWAFALYMAHV